MTENPSLMGREMADFIIIKINQIKRDTKTNFNPLDDHKLYLNIRSCV